MSFPSASFYPSAMAIVFATSVLVIMAIKTWLIARQVKHVAQHHGKVPAAFALSIDLPTHQKAAQYTAAKMRVELVELMLGMGMTIVWTLMGGLDALNQTLLQVLPAGMGQQLALVVVFSVIGAAVDVPLSWYQTFKLETRFGFNRTTPAQWLSDMVKGLLLSLCFGLPLIACVLWLMHSLGHLWWLAAWGVMMGFNLLMMMVFPTWIAPLFNQFKPLEDETLKTRVTQLMQRCGLTAKGFFVMDGSRRSAHANAYFTGLGAAKRVVFYDTLLAQLSPDEVEAVLAHELGHFHHRHVTQRLASMAMFSLLGLALLGWVSGQTWFYVGLGVQPSLNGFNEALALLLFLMVVPMLTFWINPLTSAISRRHEFEADAYATQHSPAGALASALTKLYRDNASTLTPDPWYVRFYYSHPPALQRLQRMGQANTLAGATHG